MTVTAPAGIPAGTTILKIDGKTIYLSQIPDANHADEPAIHIRQAAGAYRPDSAKYTTPFTLKFSAADTPNAKLFAGSVYEAWLSRPLPSRHPHYLPASMNLVDHVIKF